MVQTGDVDSLLQQVGQGGSHAQQAFRLLFDRYYIRFRMFYVGNRLPDHEAQDVAQESMFRIFRQAGAFNQQGKAEAWMWQIARNCFIDHHRKRKLERKRFVQVGDISSLDADFVGHQAGKVSGLQVESHTSVQLGTEAVGVARMGFMDDAMGPDALAEEEELQRCVAAGMQRFKAEDPHRHWAMVLAAQEFSMEEIGELIGRTSSATKQFLFQCRRKLEPFLSTCRGFVSA